MNRTRIAVIGAGGRMGRNLIKAIDENNAAELSGALEREGAAQIGADCGVLAGLKANGIMVSASMDDAFAGADAILDFTAPSATVAVAAYAATNGIAHVIGTTGLSADDDRAIAAAADRTAIAPMPNDLRSIIVKSAGVWRL